MTYKTVDVRLIKQDRIIYTGNQSNAIWWVEDILQAVTDFSLQSELNTMQVESTDGLNPESVWFDKGIIPLYFVNLLLKPHGMEMIEHATN